MTTRLLFLTPLLLISLIANASADPAEFAPGRLIFRLTDEMADQVVPYLEGRDSLTGACDGDPTLEILFQEYGVEGMDRLFRGVDVAVKNRGSLTPYQAWQAHHLSIRLKYPGRAARAPRGVVPVPTHGIFVLRFDPNKPVLTLCTALKESPLVMWAEPDFIVKADYSVNDSRWGNLWGIQRIGCATAWDTARGSGVVVCVNDTGSDLDHEDLASVLWVNTVEQNGTAGVDDDSNGFIDDVNGWDFVNNDNDPNDDHGHGTHCAGTVAAAGNNSVGVVGVAFEAKVMTTKGMAASNGGTVSWLSGGINYAVSNGADVVSNSWGSTGYSTSYISVIQNALSQGVMPVFAHGNGDGDGVGVDGSYHSPSGIAEAISVAASNASEGRAGFSNYGIKVDVTAPGHNILSCQMNGGYVSWQGTSMATPHVAGALAVLISEMNGRALSPSVEQMRTILRAGATDIEVTGWGRREAHGRLSVSGMVGLSAMRYCEARILSPNPGAPEEGSTITVSGHAWAPAAYFQNYRLEYAPDTPRDADSWTAISSSTTSVQGGTLGTWDVSSVPDGRYTLRLVAVNDQNQEFTDRYEVVLDTISDDTYSQAVPLRTGPTSFHVFADRNLGDHDDDWFSFHAVSGEAYLFVTSRLSGPTDTVIELYDTDGTTLLTDNDDHPDPGDKKSRVEWTCPATGTYYLMVHGWFNSSTYPNPDKGSYRLEGFGLFEDAHESDDAGSTQAAAITVNGAAHHRSILPAGDVDWASFQAAEGQAYKTEVTPADAATTMTLDLIDTDGSTVLTSGSVATDGSTRIAGWSCPTAGTYFLRIAGATGATGHYLARVFGKRDILYSEDFETVADDLWAPDSGTWGVVSGEYVDQSDAATGHLTEGGLAAWTDVVMKGTLRLAAPLNHTAANAGLILRWLDSDNFVMARVRRDNSLEIVQYENGTQVVLARRDFTSADNTDYDVTVTYEGDTVAMAVDGQVRLSVAAPRFRLGKIGLRSFGSWGAFDDITVWRPGSATGPADLAVDTSALHPGMQGAAYRFDLSASGGDSPYTFNALGATLPAGMTLDTDGTFHGTPTVSGSFTIHVSVEDGDDRIAARAITWTVVPAAAGDTTAPSISFVDPTQGAEVGASPCTLKVDVTDPSAVSRVEARVGSGSWADLSWTGSDRWEGPVSLSEGGNAIEVRATDYSGNAGTDSIDVDLDTTPPELTVDSATDGDLFFSASLTLDGEALDAVSVTVNGSPADSFNSGTGAWIHDITLAYGENTVTVVALDQFSRPTQIVLHLHHRLKGDVDGDGDVDDDDARMVLQFEAGSLTPESHERTAGDVDGDGDLDGNDAYAIRRASRGDITFS